jgi:hypothetical protein
MGWIAPAVAPNPRVRAYDWAGRSWSDPVDIPQDAIQISTDLHALLSRAHVPGPYALAGRSFGGPYVLTFRRHLSRRGRRNGRHRHHSTCDQAEEHQRRRRQLHDPLDRASALLSMSARLGVTAFTAPFERGSLPTT